MQPVTVARRCQCDLAEYQRYLDELTLAGVAARNADGIIYSRRMVRDAKRRNDAKCNGRKGGNPLLLRREVIPPDNPTLNLSGYPPLKMTMKLKLNPELKNSSEFLAAWEEWVTHLGQKNETVTEISENAQLDEFNEMGLARALAAIRFSITKNYSGIHEPKTNQAAQKKSALSQALGARK